MKTVVFANCKGGTGKSLLCALAGKSLASSGQKVTVVDADPFAPALALAFGVEGPSGSMVSVAEGLDLWTVPPADHGSEWPALTEGFRLIDCAPGLCSETRRALSMADKVVLVTVPEPVALLGALRAAREAVNVRSGIPLALVVNRCDGDRLGAHVASRFDAALGRFLSTGLEWSLTVGEHPRLHRRSLARSLASTEAVPKSLKALAEKLAVWEPKPVERAELTLIRSGQAPQKAA
ncbi:MAG: AAA family ATPase [Armatimonadetes bacterium]|nr:AAA family ATPase [Armatimonadota bacterium]